MPAVPLRAATLVNARALAQALVEGGFLLAKDARLVLAMARRDLVTRHSGQVLGIFWIIGQPLILTLVYILIFGFVFARRMDASYELPLDFTAYILSGLLPWLSFVNAMSTSCGSIIGNASLVKQFVFRLETLPAKDVVIALVIWGIGIPATLLYIVLSQQTAHVSWLLLPVALLFQTLAMVGLAFAFSAISVFFRDLKEFVQAFATVNVFLMPVVYLPGWIPDVFRPIIYLNPFSYMVWVYRDVIYYGRIEHPWAWLVFGGGALMVFAFGYRIFRKLKPMFANVL